METGTALESLAADITSERMILEHPPQWHVHKNWNRTPGEARAAINLNG